MTQFLSSGRIVWATIPDANGIQKLRPAVVVKAANPLDATGRYDVVAVTSRVLDPLPEDHVLLPWHPKGHPRTRLNRRCAAVCTWLVQIADSDIQDLAGIVPTPIMGTILAKVAAAVPPNRPPAGAGGGAMPPSGPACDNND